VIHSAVLFCEGDEISEDLIVFPKDDEGLAVATKAVRRPPGAAYHLLKEIPKEKISEALSESKGNVARAARSLGVTVRALYYHFKRNNLNPGQYRQG
jgi:DNA-binding NtrC family response regulator